MNFTHKNSAESFVDHKRSGKSDAWRFKVWQTLKQSQAPMTDREVMAVLHESDFNNIRPEITRLKQDGLIEEAGKVKCIFTGKTVRCCVATDKPYFSKGNKKSEVLYIGHQHTFFK